MSSKASGPIVHIAQHLATLGGLETLILDLLERGDPRDMAIALEGSIADLETQKALAPLKSRLFAMSKAPGIDGRLIWRLTHLLRDLKPRAVMAHHIGPLLYGGIACRLARVPTLVYYEHDTWHYKSGNDRKIAQICARTLRPRFATVSPAAAKDMRQIFGDVAIEVVPPGIDTTRFQIRNRASARQSLGWPLQATIIGSAGRLAEVKGHRFLLDAMATLDPSYRLALVGEGSQRSRLEEQAQALGIAQRVYFLGHRADIAHILPALDLFVLPSLSEGLPRALMEAQACGLKVVASDVGAVADALVDGLGKAVHPADAGALSAAIEQMLVSNAAPQAIRSRAVARYSIDAVERSIDKLTGIGALEEGMQRSAPSCLR